MTRLAMLGGAAALLMGLCGEAVASPVTVLANNPSPGDSFTNPGGTNQGQAVGSSGWYYNNTRDSGVVGINTNLPRSGNGSVSFSSPGLPGKADIEYLANGVSILGNFAAAGSLGLFSQLTAMSYEWYRVGTSTNPSVQHPALRVLLDADGNLLTTGDRGGLVFERAYNSLPTPIDAWTPDSITGSSFMWNFGLGLGTLFDLDPNSNPFDSPLSAWQAALPNAVILGFSAGVGSGWDGVFNGAVDNISWTINGQTTTTNFEVRAEATAVPAPAALGLFGLALAGLALTRRRG